MAKPVSQKTKDYVVQEFIRTMAILEKDGDFQIDSEGEWQLEVRGGKMFAKQSSGHSPQEFEITVVAK